MSYNQMIKRALFALALLAMAVPALAAGGAEAAETPNLFAGDLGNVRLDAG